MEKSNKNIIEAGITPAEFDNLFAGDVSFADYLSAFPEQSLRYSHLADLAGMRGLSELEDYFFELSGLPRAIDDCD